MSPGRYYSRYLPHSLPRTDEIKIHKSNCRRLGNSLIAVLDKNLLTARFVRNRDYDDFFFFSQISRPNMLARDGREDGREITYITHWYAYK